MSAVVPLLDQPRLPLPADDFDAIEDLLPLGITIPHIGHGIGLFRVLHFENDRLQPTSGGIAIYSYRRGLERFGDSEIAALAERCLCAEKAKAIRARRYRGEAQELRLKVSMAVALAGTFETLAAGLELRPKPPTIIPRATLRRPLREGEDMGALFTELCESLPGWARTVAEVKHEHEALIERIIGSHKMKRPATRASVPASGPTCTSSRAESSPDPSRGQRP